MIFVTLGTQDKPFTRLLQAVDEAKRKGIIKEKVIVQAGCTHYQSDVLEVVDLIPIDKFNQYLEEASLIITHGGVGSILSSLQKGKKVIACPRLSKYKEHTNDHQLELIEVFGKENYILPLIDTSKFEEVYQQSKTFQPKTYKSNQQHFIKEIETYLRDENISWYNKTKKGAFSYFFVILTVFFNYFLFWIFNCFHISTYLSDMFAFIVSFSLLLIIHFCFLFSNDSSKRKKEILAFFLLGISSYAIGMEGLYLFINNLLLSPFLSKIVLLLILTILFSLLGVHCLKNKENQ